ncbi:hypothetical protein ABW19_dt0202300 [Dactylella cylindrospora]|nr:hypothetical protein ABW19_dt0202300 [Dactylella cylindrospora]
MGEPIPSSLQFPSSTMDAPMDGTTDGATESNLGALNGLPLRPPTPPRDTAKSTSNPDNSLASLDAPDGGPSSSAESVENGQKRRVNFSPYTTYHQPCKYDGEKQVFPTIRTISMSSQILLPSKSIIKPFDPPLISWEDLEKTDNTAAADSNKGNQNVAFKELLDSACTALRCTDRTKKADIYASLANSVRGYDMAPDKKLLAESMEELTGFIQRDLTSSIEGICILDTALIKLALKVLTILAWSPDFAELMPEDHVNWFVNHAISILDEGSSKALCGMFLYFLSQQKFSSKYITLERATKMIRVVDELKTKQQGMSISAERISLYGRLLVQARPAMVENANIWVEHLFQGLLSVTNETRKRSMTLANEMAIQIGNEGKVSRAVHRLFPSKKKEVEKPDQGPKSNFFIERLEKMLQSKDDAVNVPQIWGITISLLRGLTTPIDRWEHFSQFLSIMSKCFNSSGQTLKVQAHLAWAKLIYVSNISVSITQKNLDLLLRPIVGFIDEKKGSRHLKPAKKAAIHNICTLLYYGFRPGASTQQIEFFWEELVSKQVGKYLLTSKAYVGDGCDILNGLFGGNGKWVEHRPLIGTPIVPEELPRLDPKWIRARSSLIFKILGIAFKTCIKSDDPSYIPHLALWKKLMANVAESAKKEIRISAEMMDFIANLLTFLKGLWASSFTQQLSGPEASTFLTHFVILVQLALKELGTTCFTEKWLSDDGNNNFAAISTPSEKSWATSNKVIHHPPLWHLFRLFIDPFEGACIGDNYARPISQVLSLCIDAQDSRRKRISLLAQGIAILPTHDTSEIHRIAWTILAQICNRVLPIKERDTKSVPFLTGSEIRDVVSILEWGCHHCGNDEYELWKQLYGTLYDAVVKEHGLSYIGPAVIDPLSEVMRFPKIDSESTMALNYIITVALSLKYPPRYIPYDKVYKDLFGEEPRRRVQNSYTSVFFEVMGQAFRRTFDLAQVTLDAENDDISCFLSTMQEVVQRAVAQKAPSELITQIILNMQDGLSLWLTCEKPADTRVTAKFEPLLKDICFGLERSEPCDSDTLRSFAHLIAASLECKNPKVVVVMLDFWNRSFGKQLALDYPPRVRKAINNIRRLADLKLPSFPDSTEDEAPEAPQIFLETQVSDFGQHVLPTPSKNSPLVSYRDMQQPPSSAISSKVSSNPGRQSHQKLRHMDSQIEYQPIYGDENDDPDGMESQLMTDRQREVRDRQGREADLFRDLNSSPTLKRSRAGTEPVKSPMKLDLRMPNPMSDNPNVSSPLPQPSSPTDEAMSSPVPFQASMNRFTSLIDQPLNFPLTSDDIPSSPTTRVIKELRVPQLDDIPSSPPLQPADIPRNSKVSGTGGNLETIDPKSVELSQGSKIRIEEGELPPHLNDVAGNFPRSPREAVELQEYEATEGQTPDGDTTVNKDAENLSQLEDISMHLASQVGDNNIQEGPVSSSTNKDAFSTAPEVADEKADDEESVYSNVPDSPSSRLSSSRGDSAELESNASTSRHKRKRSQGQAQSLNNDNDEEMLDCIVVSQEPKEIATNSAINHEEHDDQPPPAKKAKAAPEESNIAATRVQPPRTRRSLFSRSTSDTGEFSQHLGVKRNVIEPRRSANIDAEGVQEPKQSTKKTKKTTGTPGPNRRSKAVAASYLSVPDSQSPRKTRSRRESFASVTSAQDVRSAPVPISTELSLDINGDDGEENTVSKKRVSQIIPTTMPSPEATPEPSSLVERFEALYREMKHVEFTGAELNKLDATAFNIMHWVREKRMNAL